MADDEKAKVFMSGRSQAVRIPARYRFRTSEVYVRRDPQSGAITLSEEPPRASWAGLFAELDEAVGAEGALQLGRDSRAAEERDLL